MGQSTTQNAQNMTGPKVVMLIRLGMIRQFWPFCLHFHRKYGNVLFKTSGATIYPSKILFITTIITIYILI